MGGAEHAVLHLLYARFWHKALYDLGLVSTPEPFVKLVNQGMITGEDGAKMSKSLGNVINPDEMVENYGADAVRLYEMFMGPLEKSKPWQTNGIEGIHRFLKRIYSFFVDDEGKLSPAVTDDPPSQAESKALHQTIRKVGSDVENLKFNTAISQMMVCMNAFQNQGRINRKSAKDYILTLSPFAPHLAEELWSLCGGGETLAYEPWPVFEESLCAEDEISLPVQINGKLRVQLKVPPGIEKNEALRLATEREKVNRHLQGKTIRKVIFVPDKILNLVV